MDQDPLLHRFQALGSPLAEEARSLLGLVRAWHRAGPGTELFRQGEPAGTLFLLRRGWAKRFCILPDGRTQVLDFLLPGEFGDVTALMARRHDHACTTLTEAEVGAIAATDLFDRLAVNPRTNALLWWLALHQGEVMRKRVVGMGSRTARERLCSMLWEIHQRLRRVGLATDSSFHLPIRQRDLADAVGLTPVHTSRTLRTLERDGVVRLRRDSARILDPQVLEREAGLHTTELFLDGLPRGFPWHVFDPFKTAIHSGNTEVENAEL